MRWLYVVLGLVILAGCGSLQTVDPTPRPTSSVNLNLVPQAKGPLPAIEASDSRSLGDPNAPVTIIEYSDFQCPFCHSYVMNTFPKIKQDYIDTGKVRYVFRNLIAAPSHTAAPAAALASMCAAEQGQFWAFHDRLFGDPAAWSTDDGQTITMMKEYAMALGLDSKAFAGCLERPELTQQITTESAEGLALGAIGTPAFFINDKFINGAQSYPNFAQMIESELARAARGNE